MLLLIMTSAGLRFTNLGDKVYWHDEAYSSLRVFGHTGPEYYAGMFDGNIHSTADLQSLQHANADLGIAATLNALASRPEHPPLYYLLARIWAGHFADPVVALRSLSALFGLLLLPAVYWFAREVFGDPRVSWMSVLLTATSPLFLLYAQEARQYALWSLLTALSGAAMLYALRTGERRAYYFYALTIALGLYAHIMFAFAVLTHALYLLLTRGDYSSVAVRTFSIALACGVLVFTPWMVVLIGAIADVSMVTGWMHNPVTALVRVQSWLTSINRVFFDFPASGYLIPISSALVITALLTLYRRTPAKTWLAPVLLLAITAGAVIVPDLVDSGRRSLETRYLLPALLALELCVAYLLATGIALQTLTGRLMAAVGLLVIAGGIFSQVVIVSSNTWWNKSFSANNAEVAALINATDRPLLIGALGDVSPGELLSLSYMLADRVQLLLLRDATLPVLPDGYSRYFVLNPPWGASQAEERNYTLHRLEKNYPLWDLRRRDDW